jgi:DNA-binding transcriptional ArsR family regulator
MSDCHPYAALQRVFHEPNRLAIVSALCSAPEGLSFKNLRDDCTLTDGNLSRHLRALEEAGAVRIEKTFVGTRPRTTVFISEAGRNSFLAYLQALEEVLRHAAEAATERAAPRSALGLAEFLISARRRATDQAH